MTYADIYEHAKLQRPKFLWTRIHRWGGLIMFGLFCAGAGNVLATAEFKITDLWSKQGQQQAEIHHLKTQVIPQLKADIPKDVGHGKSDHPVKPSP